MCAARPSGDAPLIEQPCDRPTSGPRKERALLTGHCLDQQSAVEEQVSRLAAGLGDQQAAVAGHTVQRAVIGGRGRLVVGADRVVRTHLEAPQGRAQNAAEVSGRRDEAAQGVLVSGG